MNFGKFLKTFCRTSTNTQCDSPNLGGGLQILASILKWGADKNSKRGPKIYWGGGAEQFFSHQEFYC